MTDPAALRNTPLHPVHVAAGARMVAFGGWDMPVHYTGVIDEHLAVRNRAGLFDVSHMGEAFVRGKEALPFLQHVTCNDVSRLTVGRIQYSALTTPEGTFVDDLLVYRTGESEFLLVLNAANTPKDVAWLVGHAEAFEVAVRDESAAWAQLALQGPRAAAVVADLASKEAAGIKSYTFLRCEVGGIPSIVSRTGYTGEDGFEIYAPAGAAEELWHSALAAGAPHGLVPAGLGARDTLRLEAKLALYGNDIDDTTTVLEADLAWIAKLDKEEFLGRDALLRQREEGLSQKLVGFETEGRAVARHGHAALSDGAAVGRVTSGSFSPTLKKNIGLAYLPPGMWEPGTRFEVEIRGRREPAVVVPTPFYKRAR